MFTAPPHPVAVPEIEKELARLWQAAGGEQTGEERSLMRASVSNLVAFAPRPEAGAKAAETLLKVITRHPCRVLLLQVQPDLEPDDTRAEVALACLTTGGTRLCCEYVSLAACGQDRGQLPGATLPLLLTDLPTFLWWLEDPPFGSEEFLRLAEAADRLVVDTARFNSPLSTFNELAMHVNHSGHRTAVSDLNWARLTPWRVLTASLFDSRDWLPFLDQIDTVEIVLNSADANAPVNPIAAFLLLGWLATRLGWRLERRPIKMTDKRLEIDFYAGERRVRARLDFIAGTPHGRLRSLRLRAAHASPAAAFDITRASDTPHAETRVQVGDHEPMVRVNPYAHRGVAELLAEEMEHLGRDLTFEAALEVAESIRAMLQVEIYVPV